MKLNNFNQKAFSLIELMVAVGIVGILVSMAIPAYNSFKIKAARVELRQNLSTIATLQHTYRTENGAYVTGSFGPISTTGAPPSCGVGGAVIEELGLRLPNCDLLKYAYQTTGFATSFLAWGVASRKNNLIRGNPPVSPTNCDNNTYYDSWQIDHDNIYGPKISGLIYVNSNGDYMSGDATKYCG